MNSYMFWPKKASLTFGAKMSSDYEHVQQHQSLQFKPFQQKQIPMYNKHSDDHFCLDFGLLCSWIFKYLHSCQSSTIMKITSLSFLEPRKMTSHFLLNTTWQNVFPTQSESLCSFLLHLSNLLILCTYCWLKTDIYITIQICYAQHRCLRMTLFIYCHKESNFITFLSEFRIKY